MPIHNWSSLLDELKRKEQIQSDYKLAEVLGVTRGFICAVRKGRKDLSFKLAGEIMTKLGRAFEIESLKPLFVPSKVRSHLKHIRNLRLKAILRANGHCQLCGMEAPFKAPDGTPYLELHHVVPNKDGGSDDLSNIAALCPNCHKMVEMYPSLEMQERLKKLLVESVCMKTQVR